MQYKNWTSWSNNFSLITELPSFYDRIKLAADISNFTFDLCSPVAMIQVQVSTGHSLLSSGIPFIQNENHNKY